MRDEKPRIMIVDDDKVVCNVTKKVLEKNKYTVEIAHSGDEGLEKIGEFNPDIILLDIMMPRMTPAEIIEEIREKDLELKIIYFSALKQNDEEDRKFREGLMPKNADDLVIDYIEKPFTKEILINKINKAMEGG